jgi:hypothetical protein
MPFTVGGINEHVNFRHCYFGVPLSGYTVQDSTIADANQLLHYYQQKIEQ